VKGFIRQSRKGGVSCDPGEASVSSAVDRESFGCSCVSASLSDDLCAAAAHVNRSGSGTGAPAVADLSSNTHWFGRVTRRAPPLANNR